MRITFRGYILFFDELIFNGTAETMLAMLTFLYCREFVKNSLKIVLTHSTMQRKSEFFGKGKFNQLKHFLNETRSRCCSFLILLAICKSNKK